MLNNKDAWFTTFNIIKMLNIKRERLRKWIDEGFITPDKKADGVGTKALFSLDSVYRIQLFLELLWIGLTREKAREIAMGITFKNVGTGNDEFKYLTIKTDKIESRMYSTGVEIEKTMPQIEMENRLSVTVLNLLTIKREVDNSISG
ncbi:MAG: MerR family transcriptional regulator [Deltaproteobacteria bacterium]|nr:MerR family transcriptional regulator [Deltaproteobacteria bacterium]